MSQHHLNRAEALRYLGHRGQPLDAALDALLDACVEEIRRVARPKYHFRFFACEARAEGVELPEAGMLLPGEDIRRHLSGCGRCVLMAATLGTPADSAIRAAQSADMSRALMLDASASAYVESVCDACEDEIRARTEEGGQPLTGRFSPGYGDLPLSLQPAILRLLDAGRRIGLFEGGAGLLLPRKSVTAILGVGAENPAKSCGDKGAERCRMCARYKQCAYRANEEEKGS